MLVRSNAPDPVQFYLKLSHDDWTIRAVATYQHEPFSGLDDSVMNDAILEGDKAESIGFIALQKWDSIGLDLYAGYRKYDVTRPDMNWKPVVLLGLSISILCSCVQEDQSTSDAARTSEIVGTKWQWQAFQDAADGDEARDITVPDPAQHTLTLQSDNSADIRADCNQLRWTYTLQGSSLAFDTLGPGTRAYCGEESLDQRYLELLGNTATYVMTDGKLYVNLKFDSGNMVFVAENAL